MATVTKNKKINGPVLKGLSQIALSLQLHIPEVRTANMINDSCIHKVLVFLEEISISTRRHLLSTPHSQGENKVIG